MKGIGEFFARIQNAQAKEVFLRKSVQDALLAIGIELEISAISFKGGDILLRGLSQTAKTQLFLKKTSLLRAISEKGLGRQVKDVRFI